MKQQLENIRYEPVQKSEENMRVYRVGDLESLSASALYIGSKPLKLRSRPLMPLKSEPLSFKPLEIKPLNLELFGIPKVSSKPLKEKSNLYIKDLPFSGIQLHIHETNNIVQEAGLKAYGDEKQSTVLFPKRLSAYELSLMDLYADNLNLKKFKK